MKKYLSLCFVVIAFCLPVTGEAFCLPDFDVEAKVSAFFPQSKNLRQVSANTIPFYEVEIARPFCNGWKAWAGVGYLSFQGRSACCKTDSDFYLVPVTLGLKYYYPLTCDLKVYAGLGACWSFLNNNDYSNYVHRHITTSSLGGLAEVGFTLCAGKGVFLDFFAQYLLQKFNFNYHYIDQYTERHDVNFSGLKAGLGLGFEF